MAENHAPKGLVMASKAHKYWVNENLTTCSFSHAYYNPMCRTLCKSDLHRQRPEAAQDYDEHGV